VKDLWQVKFEKSKVTLLALIMVGQAEIQKRLKSKRGADSNTTMTQRQFRSAKHFGNFALEIYMPSFFASDHNICKQFGLANSCDVIFKCFESPTEDRLHPDFVIIQDHKTKSFVLVIRGTFDFKDVLIDLNSDDSPFLDGQAHTGILTGAKEILKKVKPILTQEMNKKPNYQLVITGHSLGAGTAELITMMILTNKEDHADLVKHGVKCYALAPPPVYRSEQNLPDEIVNSIEIYINNNDCVPSLSLGTVKKLLNTMIQVDEMKMSTVGVGLLLAGKDIFGDMESLIHTIESAEQKDFPYLHHPGTIFHLECRKKKSYHILRRPSDVFSTNLAVRLGMVLDHIQDGYKTAFSKVGQLWLASSLLKRSLKKSWNRFTRASRSRALHCQNKEDDSKTGAIHQKEEDENDISKKNGS